MSDSGESLLSQNMNIITFFESAIFVQEIPHHAFYIPNLVQFTEHSWKIWGEQGLYFQDTPNYVSIAHFIAHISKGCDFYFWQPLGCIHEAKSISNLFFLRLHLLIDILGKKIFGELVIIQTTM